MRLFRMYLYDSNKCALCIYHFQNALKEQHHIYEHIYSSKLIIHKYKFLDMAGVQNDHTYGAAPGQKPSKPEPPQFEDIQNKELGGSKFLNLLKIKGNFLSLAFFLSNQTICIQHFTCKLAIQLSF